MKKFKPIVIPSPYRIYRISTWMGLWIIEEKNINTKQKFRSTDADFETMTAAVRFVCDLVETDIEGYEN